MRARSVQRGTMLTRSRRRLVSVAAVCMAMVSLLPAVQATAEPTGLVFNVRLDPALAGGAWMLSTHTGADQLQSVVLAKGDVPADGTVSLSLLPMDVAAVSTSHMFFFRALRPIDEHSAYYSSASAGLLAEEVERGTVLDLPGSAVAIVPLYDSLEALKAAMASVVEPAAPAPAPTVQADPEPEPPSVYRISPTSPVPAPPIEADLAPVATEPPVDGCLATASCGTATALAADSSCSGAWYSWPMEDCIVSAQDITGIRAARGHSHRASGMRNTFKVTSQNTQKWQSARRVSGGVFSFDGNKTTQSGVNQTDTWEREGDCWAGDVDEDAACSTHGSRRRFGNDTWRYERHAVRWNFGLWASEKVMHEDRLFVKGYDGGAREDDPVTRDGYYESPFRVGNLDGGAGGSYGRWAPYHPGMTRDITLEKSKEETNGASVTLNWGQGGGSFTSSVSNQTVAKVVNYSEFLARTSFNDPVAAPWKNGYWLRYDRGSDWAMEDWTCRHASGWSNTGATGTNCWPGQ
jgi:hypothetical protein